MESYWAYKVLWIEKLPKHSLTWRTRVVPVCYVNDLQIMGLWEIFKLQLSLQAMVLFRTSWVAMRLGTLQCTLSRDSNTSIEIDHHSIVFHCMNIPLFIYHSLSNWTLQLLLVFCLYFCYMFYLFLTYILVYKSLLKLYFWLQEINIPMNRSQLMTRRSINTSAPSPIVLNKSVIYV